MKITMKEAIECVIAREDSKPQSTPLNTLKQEWKGLTVKEAITRPDIQEMLLKSGNDQEFYFSDTLPQAQLYADIDKLVIEQLTNLIDSDAVSIDAPKVQFTEDQVQELTEENPDLLLNLKLAVDELQANPYEYTLVKEFLPALVELENLKKPDFDLRFGSDKEALVQIGKWVKKGVERGAIVCLIDAQHHKHAHYIDYKLVDGKPSVLWIDSWYIGVDLGQYKEFQRDLKLIGRDIGEDIAFGGIELQNQSSDHGCPIFALNTAKQAYKDPKGLDALHQKNIDLPASAKRKLQADTSLPAHFMKHVQSGKRLNEFLSRNPHVAKAPINAKGETLEGYRAEHSLYDWHDDETLMRSIFQKRLEYLTEVQTAFGMPQT